MEKSNGNGTKAAMVALLRLITPILTGLVLIVITLLRAEITELKVDVRDLTDDVKVISANMVGKTAYGKDMSKIDRNCERRDDRIRKLEIRIQ